MDKKELAKIITAAYTKYMHAAFQKLDLYLSGELTWEEFKKELEVLVNECREELSN